LTSATIMPGTVVDALLLSLGIAFSPIPVLAIVALLLSARSRPIGLGFTCGWLGGIVVVVTAATAFARYSERLGVAALRQSAAVAAVVLGVVAVVAGVAVWFLRSSGTAGGQPRWLAGLDQMSVPQAVLLGIALSVLNPKNLLACILAGLMIGWSGLSSRSAAAWTAAFSLVASSTVLLPMLSFLILGRAVRVRFTMVRDWLVRHHAGVVSTILIVIGALLVIRGLGGS
jgi:hypothetical protein